MKVGSPDGRVNPSGATLASIQSATVEKVLAARNEYALLQKQKDEAAKKKAAEEKLKLDQQQKAAKEKQAYINSLKNAKTDEATIKKIYDANIDDMRKLGKEMRTYAPYNPKLVIAMLNYMGYTESDNLAYNITSNFSDSELARLDKALLKTLKEYLEAGWTEDTEALQVKRIDKLIGGKDKVVGDVKKEEVKTEEVEPTTSGKSSALWLDYAIKEAGTKEIKGKESNPRIDEYLATTALVKKDQHDGTAWCASFANWCMKQVNIKGAGAGGKDWRTWGKKLDKPAVGAVIVFNTNHVAMIMGKTKNGKLVLVHGNWSQKVTISPYGFRESEDAEGKEEDPYIEDIRYPNGYAPSYNFPIIDKSQFR